MVVTVSPFVANTLPVHSLPLAVDESLHIDTSQQSPDSDEFEQPQLTPGIPQSTTVGDIRLQGAQLTWTRTGINEIQDTYEVIVSQSNDVFAGILTGERLVNETGLTTPQIGIEQLGEGTFYWQVRSCMLADACNGWSPIESVIIDGTAPSPPTAMVTSGMYEKSVTVSGTAEQGSTVTTTTGDTICQTTTSNDGSWTCTFNDDFDYGTYDALITVTDKAGNHSSQPLTIRVKELFIAPQITSQELPPVLEIVPIDETAQNKVFQQPISVVDSVAAINLANEEDVLGAAASALTTDGGVIQASESGWQVVGVPWFVWAGSVTSILAGWWVFGGPGSRRLGSMLSL